MSYAQSVLAGQPVNFDIQHSVRSFLRAAAPPLDPEFMAQLRECLPRINDRIEQLGPEIALALYGQLLRKINCYDKAIFIEKIEDESFLYELCWQLGRLKDNLGQHEEALFYLKSALNLHPDDLRVVGRIIDTELKAFAASGEKRYFEEAKNYLDILTTLENSDFTQGLVDRLRNAQPRMNLLRDNIHS